MLNEIELIAALGSADNLDASQLAQLDREGLLPLLKRLPEALRTTHDQQVFKAAAWEAAHRHVVTSLLATLAAADLDVIVFKGTALAYTCYDAPWERTRTDTDLLIRETDVASSQKVLTDLGFYNELSLPGQLATAELAFYLDDDMGVSQPIDLHWRLSNNWLLAGVLSFDDIWREKLPVLGLGEQVWQPSWRQALIIACLHRAAHMSVVTYEVEGAPRPEGNRLIWTYDIHLLAAKLDDADWHWLVNLAGEKKVAAVVAEGISRSIDLLATAVPAFVVAELTKMTGQIPVSRFANQRQGELESLMAIPGVRLKLGYLREQLFPHAAYMRQCYPGDSLARAHAKRLTNGLRKRWSAV